jgi:hypothetical protein
MYRDAANWKEHFQVVFPGEISPEEEERLKEHLSDFKYFIAGDVGLPELQWGMEGFPTENDHAWHELSEVRLVDTPPTCDTSIHTFVEEFCELPPPAPQGGVCAVELPKKSQLSSRLLGDQVVGQVLDDRQPVVKTVPSVNLYVLVVHTARGEQPVE